MSESSAFGRLEQLDLRVGWASEAGGFTPWLAREENLVLLGETIGIELELEGQEQDVGPFRADILCKDSADGNWVLIENQLERTDHTHLGQLLTYAAGLKAVTIVWIAQRFTEEHRAALDWLNEITDDSFTFFGLEVELWRIGTSPIAPKFNIVCKPNDWTKIISGAARRIDESELTETKLLQQEYWSKLTEHLAAEKAVVRPQKPLPQHWTNFSIGRSNFQLSALVNTRDSNIAVQLSMTGPIAKARYHSLYAQRADIEIAYGEPFEWEELPNKKESRIVVRRLATDPTDKSQWAEQHRWLGERLNRFHAVFRERVRMLDAE